MSDMGASGWTVSTSRAARSTRTSLRAASARRPPRGAALMGREPTGTTCSDPASSRLRLTGGVEEVGDVVALAGDDAGAAALLPRDDLLGVVVAQDGGAEAGVVAPGHVVGHRQGR